MPKHKNKSNEQFEILSDEYGELRSITINFAENGYSVDCEYHKEKVGDGLSNYHTEKKVFNDRESMMAFIGDILDGKSESDEDS